MLIKSYQITVTFFYTILLSFLIIQPNFCTETSDPATSEIVFDRVSPEAPSCQAATTDATTIIAIEKLIEDAKRQSPQEAVLNDPASVVPQRIAEFQIVVPQEKKTLFLEKVVALLQTPEAQKRLHTNLVATLRNCFDRTTAQDLATFFSQHSLQNFIHFQNELADLIAAIFFKQQFQATPPTTPITPEYATKAQQLLRKILQIKKQGGEFFYLIISPEELVVKAITVCAKYFELSDINDMMAFVEQPAGHYFVFNYAMIEKLVKNQFEQWTDIAITAACEDIGFQQPQKQTLATLIQKPSAIMSFWEEIKSKLENIENCIRAKLYQICKYSELRTLKYSQNSQATFQKLLNVTGASLDQLLRRLTENAATNDVELQGAIKAVVQNLNNSITTLPGMHSQPQRGVCDPTTTKLIDELFAITNFEKIQTFLVLIITHAIAKMHHNPIFMVKYDAIQKYHNDELRSLIAANLNPKEIADLITFLKSPVMQKLTNHGQDFCKLFFDGLGSKIIEYISEFIPWHIVL